MSIKQTRSDKCLEITHKTLVSSFSSFNLRLVAQNYYEADPHKIDTLGSISYFRSLLRALGPTNVFIIARPCRGCLEASWKIIEDSSIDHSDPKAAE